MVGFGTQQQPIAVNMHVLNILERVVHRPLGFGPSLKCNSICTLRAFEGYGNNVLSSWHSRLTGNHPIQEVQKKSQHGCQWCRYKENKCESSESTGSSKAKVVWAKIGCIACGVWFCGADCWNEFHGLD